MKNAYVTEQQVKNALRIDSFRNLSKEKIMEFVSLIPNMDKDVAISIINQFPSYVEMAKDMVEQLSKTCDTAMSENHISQIEVFSAYKRILDDLGEILKRSDITPEERKYISNQMINIADKMAEKDTENKDFISYIIKSKEHIVLGALIFGAAILGINIRGNKIPTLN